MERKIPREDRVHLSGLDLVLWAASFFGECVLLAVLLLRRRAARFPAFTALMAVGFCRAIAMYLIVRLAGVRSHTYFYTYWTIAIIDVALQLALAYQLCIQTFLPLGVWAPDLRRAAATIGILSLLVAGGLTLMASPPTRTLRLAVAIRGDFFATVLLSEIFVAMVAVSVRMRYAWRTHAARIALGFGVYATVAIVVDIAYNYFGSTRNAHIFNQVSQARICLYLICLAFWIVTLWRDEPMPQKLPDNLREQLLALQRRVSFLLSSLRRLEQM